MKKAVVYRFNSVFSRPNCFYLRPACTDVKNILIRRVLWSLIQSASYDFNRWKHENNFWSENRFLRYIFILLSVFAFHSLFEAIYSEIFEIFICLFVLTMSLVTLSLGIFTNTWSSRDRHSKTFSVCFLQPFLSLRKMRLNNLFLCGLKLELQENNCKTLERNFNKFQVTLCCSISVMIYLRFVIALTA